MKQTELKRRKGLNPISDKQRAKNKHWNEVTAEKCYEVGFMCQWCGFPGQRNDRTLFSFLDGHHIIGAQTKPAKYPRIEWVEEIIGAADKAGVPVFLKDNLRPLAEESTGVAFPLIHRLHGIILTRSKTSCPILYPLAE
ncbi:unnamed protein product [marine sediment metagenome]|uniref:Uncharacterized protein n=1 Tax=marine sediment metagenome TaxID=412755 RepID=X1IG71_9ZZZZ